MLKVKNMAEAWELAGQIFPTDYEKDVERSNDRLNEEIGRQISMWDGTIFGFAVKNMYENGSDYESICEQLGIDYEAYKED